MTDDARSVDVVVIVVVADVVVVVVSSSSLLFASVAVVVVVTFVFDSVWGDHRTDRRGDMGLITPIVRGCSFRAGTRREWGTHCRCGHSRCNHFPGRRPGRMRAGWERKWGNIGDSTTNVSSMCRLLSLVVAIVVVAVCCYQRCVGCMQCWPMSLQIHTIFMTHQFRLASAFDYNSMLFPIPNNYIPPKLPHDL